MKPRIQVQIDTKVHRENFVRDFKAAEPAIVLTHIREDNMADMRYRVAEARWESESTIEYKHTPEFGAHAFVTVHGPVWYRYQSETEWRELRP